MTHTTLQDQLLDGKRHQSRSSLHSVSATVSIVCSVLESDWNSVVWEGEELLDEHVQQAGLDWRVGDGLPGW